MKSTKKLLAVIFITCLYFTGCTMAAEPETEVVTTRATAGTPIALTRPPLETAVILPTSSPAVRPPATNTPHPSATPFPTATPTVILPTATDVPPTIPPSPTPTLAPTPTLYPDGWASGLLRNGILMVGTSSVRVADSTITYEPLNEQVAQAIASIPLGALVVCYGDFTPYGPGHDFQGNMVIERIEPVNLPYSEETPLTASYTHPNNLFTFAYPDGWTLNIEDNGDTLSLFNRPPEKRKFRGPGMEYHDPTSKYITIKVESMSLDAYVLSRQEKEQTGEDVPVDNQLTIGVSQQEINGLPVTVIDEETPIWGIDRRYALSLNDNTVLVFSSELEDVHVAERVLTTLSLNVSE